MTGSEQTAREQDAAKSVSCDNASASKAGEKSPACSGLKDRYCFADRARVFFGIALVWVLYDRLTKMYFESAYSLGQVSPVDYLLVRFRLVHNTGMAWGLFGDSTFMLGVMSLLVCAGIVAVFFLYEKIFERPATLVELTGLGLVLAGGIGNAIDRFMQGYVVDFLDFTFMDFPVFNVADIGVTCGFVLFFACILLPRRKRCAQGEGDSSPVDADAGSAHVEDDGGRHA